MFVTIQELSTRTGVPERTLRYAAQKGTLVTKRFGLRKHYVPREIADQFTADCKKSGNTGNSGNSGNRAA